MKLVLATDFSTPATHAAGLAAAFAKKLGDGVVLAHVVEAPALAYPELIADFEALEKAMRAKAEQRLREEADKLRAQGIVVDERVLEGHAPDRIAECAKEVNARLVIVGTHGRRPVPRFFLGSVAERVVLTADRPVLVAHPMPSSRGLEDWAKSSRRLRIAVALDHSAPSAAAVDWVRSIRAVVPCDVTFMHFYWPPGEYGRLGLVGTRSMTEPDPTTVRTLERELGAAIGALPGEGKVELRIQPSWGELGGRIAYEASASDADLLVMGTHRRHGLRRLWLGATTQPTLHAATLPVVCVPAVEAEARLAPQPIPALREVLVATDFSPLANLAIPYAYALVGSRGVVHLAHVHERSLPSPPYAYEDKTGSILGTPEEAAVLDRLKALVPPEADKRHIESRPLVIEGAKVATTILQAANRLAVDTIVIGSHGRTGLGKALLGSVAGAIVEGSERPVYVVRTPRS